MSKLAVQSPKFYPSKIKPLLVRLCQSISPLVGKLIFHLDLVIEPESLARLKNLGTERMVLMPNHPNFSDGIAMFLLSTRWGEIFNYMVAEDNFWGLQGKFMQLMGAYSIRRGLGDRPSITQTLNLLRQRACRLVLFPEGGCSFQNDYVTPFRAGAIQLPLQTLGKLAKKDGSVPNFYLVPISIKYRYTGNTNKLIQDSLSSLETALNLTPNTKEFYPRLRAISGQVLSNIEQEYDVVSKGGCQQDWNQRIEQLKGRILQVCEEKLSYTTSDQLQLRERVYKIHHVLESRAEELTESTYQFMRTSLIRLLNFDAIYDGYVATAPTPERFLDTLTRLEREVFNIERPRPKGHRQAILQVGEPVNLKDYFKAYKEDKEGTVQAVTLQMQQAVQNELDLLQKKYGAMS